LTYSHSLGDILKKLLNSMVLSVLFLALQPVAAWSADKSLKVADAAIDLPIPDSAAYTALGVGPGLVENPSSPRAFSGSLLQGFDANGNYQIGFSVEGAPSLLYHDQSVNLREYQNEATHRLLDRTMLSFAAVKGESGADKNTRLAIGIRVTLWDTGDPRMDKNLADCLRNAIIDVDIRRKKELDALDEEIKILQVQWEVIEGQIDEASKSESKKGTLPQLEDAVRALIKKTIKLKRQREVLLAADREELNKQGAAAIQSCRSKKEIRASLWNRSSWSFGVAPTYTSFADTQDNLHSTGAAIWTSAAFAVKDYGQLILHSSYRSNESVPDPQRVGSFFEQNSKRAGGRLRFGNPDLNFSLEGLYVEEQRKGTQSTDKKIQYGASVEHRIGDDLWVVVATSNEAYNEEGNHFSLLCGLKWAYSPWPATKF
jgi:hypothetical protein